MNALAQSPLFWGALISGLLVVYVLPSLIGAIRHVEGLGWLVAFNVLFPGVGWLAGMIGSYIKSSINDGVSRRLTIEIVFNI